jgi:predicted HTH domain antitoxin
MSKPAETAARIIIDRFQSGKPTVEEVATIIDESGLLLAIEVLDKIKVSKNKYALDEYDKGYLWEKVDAVKNELGMPYKGSWKSPVDSGNLIDKDGNIVGKF